MIYIRFLHAALFLAYWIARSNSISVHDSSMDMYSIVCKSILAAEINTTTLLLRVNETNTYLLQQRRLQQPVYPSVQLGIISRSTIQIANYSAFSYWIQSLYAYHHNYWIFPLYPDDLDKIDYEYHRKLVPILSILENPEYDLDYLVWMDADLIPLDFSFRLESIASKYPAAQLLISRDVSTLVNTGCMIIRNTSWMRRFLHHWLAERNTPGVGNEQLGFEKAIASYPKDVIVEKIVILPISTLNSEAPAMGKQLPHHQILHLAAESDIFRAVVFQHAMQTLCTHYPFPSSSLQPVTTRVVLPVQLSLTREELQSLAILTYETQYRDIEATLRTYLPPSNNSNDNIYSWKYITPAKTPITRILMVDSDLVASYRMSVSKYCHAVVYQQQHYQQSTETQQTLALRYQAFLLAQQIVLMKLQHILHATQMITSLHSQHHHYDDTNEYLASYEKVGSHYLQYGQDWFIQRYCETNEQEGGFKDEECIKMMKMNYVTLPEIMKLSIELGYEFLSIYRHFTRVAEDQEEGFVFLLSKDDKKQQKPTEDGDGEEKQIVQYISSILQLLYGIVHSQQKEMIRIMQQEFVEFLHATSL